MYIFIDYELLNKKINLRCISESKININDFQDILKDVIKFEFKEYKEQFLGKYVYTLKLEKLELIDKDNFFCSIKNEELYKQYCNFNYKNTSLDLGSFEDEKEVPFIIKYFYNKELICNVKNRKKIFKYLEV